MKNKILLIVAVLISSVSFAQTTPSFGVKAGILSSSMRGNAVDNFKNILDFSKGGITTKDYTGFFAGGYATIPVTENFSIKPEIFNSLKGMN